MMKKSSRSYWTMHLRMNVPNVPNELHLNERIEQSIDQLTGYLARSAFKKHNCDACHSQLVRNVPLEVTSLHLEPMEAVFHSWEAQETCLPDMCHSQKSGSKICRIRRQNRILRSKICKIPQLNHLVRIQVLQDLTAKQKCRIQDLQDPTS